MRRIKITRSLFDELREHLLRGTNVDEEAAFLLGSSSRTENGWQVIVRDFLPVPDESLLSKGRAGLAIDPVFIAGVVKRARTSRASVILCHSHPFSTSSVRFSSIDDGGEAELFPRIAQHVASVPHGAMVFGHHSLDARLWIPGDHRATPVDEVLVTDHVARRVTPTSASLRTRDLAAGALQRQALALGDAAQHLLGGSYVVVVGIGGLGSVIAHSLARSGVGRLLLVDFDRLEEVNVSRVEGASMKSIGRFKARVVKRSIERLGLGTHVEAVVGSVLDPAVIRKILACDVMVLATDNMRSRTLVSRVGVQHAIPVVSAGIDLPRHGERLAHAGGHVAVQGAGTPCLDCLGLIDRERLEREEADSVLARHRYDDSTVRDSAEPSAHMFNTVIAGASCAEVCQLLTGALREPNAAAYLMFDARALTMQRVRAKATRDCGICTQVRDQGDRYDLPFGRPATAA